MPLTGKALLCALGLGLTLAACGSAGEESIGSSDDKAMIVSTIEKVFNDPSASDCRTIQTPAYLEQVTHTIGRAAVKSCERSAADTPPSPSRVSVVGMDGSSATARVAIDDGPLDGQILLVGLVKETGQWKLDELIRFLSLDRAKLLDGTEEALSDASDELSPALARCIVAGIRSLPDAQLEKVLLGAGGEALLSEKARVCIGRGIGKGP